ncbi:hypothetical protein [Deinococcus sonorensis]|uniref:Alpha/beta hydrolase n=2 Tax=Deinococcus sonorensis TaxID=309891 RepID=A0AAU7UBM7_9DEIO
MTEPLVLVHGFSAEGRAGEAAHIYGTLPQALRGLPLLDINLGRYVTLDDHVDLEDVTLALDRALAARPELLKGGFNALTHSTGALVLRNWVRRRGERPSPLRRLIHLAGAQWGSGWAHLGRSQLARWLHLIGQGSAERGLGVLSALELGSPWALDLHLHFLAPGQDLLRDYGVLEASLMGSALPPGWAALPFRAGREAGSDGVVRVAASNPNVIHVQVGPASPPDRLDWAQVARYVGETATALPGQPVPAPPEPYYVVRRESQPGHDGRAVVPFALLPDCAHIGPETGILTGTRPQATVLRQVAAVLKASPAEVDALVSQFEAVSAQTYAALGGTEHGPLGQVQHPAATQHDPHAQLIVRTWDQLGRPLPGCALHVNSFGGNGQPRQLINDLFEDVHVNSGAPNTLTCYLRTHRHDSRTGEWVAALPEVNGVDLELDAPTGPGGRVVVVPLRLRLDSATLQRWLEPHRTTLLDVQLLRLPSVDTFQMY